MTNEDRVAALYRYLDGVGAVALFEHGTALFVLAGTSEARAAEIMRQYDVPRDGEGSPFGDFTPMPMDDGNLLIAFTAVSEDVGAAHLYTPEEWEKVSGPAPSATEHMAVLGAVAALRYLPAGLVARGKRSLDAKQAKIVASVGLT